LWEQDAEALLAANDAGLIPWVPLARTTLEPDEVLSRCRTRLEAVPDAVDREGLTVVAQILAGLAYPAKKNIVNLFGGPRIMIESPVLDEIKEILIAQYRERFEAEGRVKGLAEGKAEGAVGMARAAILDNLEARFGVAPATTAAVLGAITDEARLRALVRVAATCADVAAFDAELARQNM
jgi:hypothetical protein